MLFCNNILIFAAVINSYIDIYMGISIESVWSKAQRLSASDRLALSRRLRESVNEPDSVRQARVASEIDRFFGGWSNDPRTTDEIMQQIREGRTKNTYPKL